MTLTFNTVNGTYLRPIRSDTVSEITFLADFVHAETLVKSSRSIIKHTSRICISLRNCRTDRCTECQYKTVGITKVLSFTNYMPKSRKYNKEKNIDKVFYIFKARICFLFTEKKLSISQEFMVHCILIHYARPHIVE